MEIEVSIMEKDLMSLRKKYNECLERNKKAEKYLMSHTCEECEAKFKRKKINGEDEEITTFELFSEVAVDLSKLIIEIEKNMGKKMTRYEILNGFKL